MVQGHVQIVRIKQPKATIGFSTNSIAKFVSNIAENQRIYPLMANHFGEELGVRRSTVTFVERPRDLHVRACDLTHGQCT